MADDDIASARRKTQRIIDSIPRSQEEFLDEVANAIVDEARSNLQNNGNINTGELLASIKVLRTAPGLRVVGSDAKQSVYIEYGRGPVMAKNGKPLRWVDKHTGEVVFSMYSGPVEPSPFFEPAVLAVTQRFKKVYVQKQRAIIGKE